MVILRDRFTCQECGIKGIRLHVHHKIPFLVSFDNSLSNLVTLCPSCHRKVDAQIIKQIKEEKMIGGKNGN
jgi:5-methylcytosine-specific restriction endonuclease McrA